MSNILSTYYLVTFLCTDPTLTDCQIYQSAPMTGKQCEAAATYTGNMAKAFEVKETVLFYCTEDTSDLPIKGEEF